MSTIKVNNIVPPNVGEGVSIDGLQMPTAGALSNRNLIINGAMQVAQRGTSSTSGSYGSVDRMKVSQSDSNTQSQLSLSSADTPYSLGFRNAFRLQNSTVSNAAASTYREIDYRIEAQDIANSGWDYTSTSSFITFSFWLKASVTQSYYLYIRTEDGTKRLLVKELAATANTWKKFELVIPGDSGITINNDNGFGLLFRFLPWYGTTYTGSGTLDAWASDTNERVPNMTSTWVTTLNSTFDLTGLQLEVGSKATPFEHESYGQTFAKCQRYRYQIDLGNESNVQHVPMMRFEASSGAAYAHLTFPCEMNSNPNFTFTGTARSAGGYAGDPVLNMVTKTSASIISTRTIAANSTVYLRPIASSSGSDVLVLNFEAEL